MTDARLKSFADRIERLMDERDAITSDIKDVFLEVKSAGYIPKALRKAIARARADQSKLSEEDAILDIYEAALGRVGKAMAAVHAGATLDEAAKSAGVHKATLARARAVAKSPEIATGNTANTQTEAPSGSLRASEQAPERNDAAGGSSPTIRSATDEELKAQRESWVRGEMAIGSDRDEAAYRAKLRAEDDDLTIPPFLDRRKVAA